AYLEQEAQYRPAGGPNSVPFTGNWHAEQFYFIANFFVITLCSMSTAPQVQYRRQAIAMGASVLAPPAPDEVAHLYLHTFGSVGQALPGKMMVLPAGPDLATGLEVEPFCYPDVYYSQALGVSAAAPDDQLRKLREVGVSVASVLYCDQGTRDRLAALCFQL